MYMYNIITVLVVTKSLCGFVSNLHFLNCLMIVVLQETP